jgi:hypothetical protein
LSSFLIKLKTECEIKKIQGSFRMRYKISRDLTKRRKDLKQKSQNKVPGKTLEEIELK